MNYVKLKLGLVLLLFYGGLNAQQAVLSAGGEAGTSSYSLGQVVYQYHFGEGGSVAGGVQQAAEFFVTSVDGIDELQLIFRTYPNPTNNLLILDLKDYPFENLTYQIFNLNGELLANNPLTNTTTSINMGNWPPSIYFLKVVKQGQYLKTFKIIKN